MFIRGKDGVKNQRGYNVKERDSNTRHKQIERQTGREREANKDRGQAERG